MQNFEILYRGCRGGALMIWLLFVLVKNVSGQGSTPIQLSCNQFDISVCQRTPNDPNPVGCTGCSASPVDCRRLQYVVRLTANANVSNANTFTLAYTDLEITTKLLFSGTNSGMTRINEQETQTTCGGSQIFFDPETGEAGLKYLTSPSLPPPPAIVFTRTQAGSPFYATLYTLVVDVFPGDVFSLGCSFFRYANGDNITCFYPNNSTPPTPNFIAPLPYQLQLNPEPQVSFNFDVPTINANNAVVPLTISSQMINELTIPYVDFFFTLQASEPIPPPVAQNYAGYDVKIVPDQNLNTSYLIKVRRTGQPLFISPGATITLFQLFVNRPNPQNLASTLTLNYIDGRFEGIPPFGQPAFCKKLTKGGNGDRVVQFAGDSECVNTNLSLNVDGYAGSAGGSCGDLFTRVSLGIPYNAMVRELRFTLDFDMSGTAYIDVANIQNGLPCNPATNLQVCTNVVGAQQCYTVSGNRLTYCFKVNPGSEVAFQGGVMEIPVIAVSSCIQQVTVSEAAFYIVGQGTVTCVPQINVSGFYVCSQEIAGTVKYGTSGDGCWVDGVNVNIKPTDNACPDVTNLFTHCPAIGSSSSYAYCVCDEGNYIITPERTDNPLNGVTTYDLVLISKHILGTEPLDSPYKIIAANGDGSNNISPIDIVTIRKLILGVTTELPVPSWIFLPKDLAFSNSENPFDPNLFNNGLFLHGSLNAQVNASGINYSFEYNNETHSASAADFVAIKMGDVNCTANTGCGSGNCICGGYPQKPAANGTFTVALPASGHLRSGETVLIPVRVTGEAPLIALQAGFRFDPLQYEYVGIAQGDVPELNMGCFNMESIAEGEFKMIWLSMDHEENYLMPGQVLYYLALRARADIPAAQERSPLQIDHRLFEGLGYTAGKTEWPIAARVDAKTALRNEAPEQIKASCTPNPVTGQAMLRIEGASGQKGRVFVMGPFGSRMYYQELDFEQFTTEIGIETASWPAGIYNWLVLADGKKVQGRFVKVN